jgi:dTMP kinase
MFPNPGPGRFVVFEGLDGAGTTTQVVSLRRRIEDLASPGESCPVYVTREPSDGPIGLQIRMVLEHRIKTDPATLAALFAADRMDHLTHRCGKGGIVAHLRSGVHVLSDRYYLSSFAYQGMSLDWNWLWDMHARCIRPDMTLFLDVPVDVCLERIAARRGDRTDLFENRNALTSARSSYLGAIHRLRQAGDAIEVVDGNASPEQVHELIWEKVQKLFPAFSPRRH